MLGISAKMLEGSNPAIHLPISRKYLHVFQTCLGVLIESHHLFSFEYSCLIQNCIQYRSPRKLYFVRFFQTGVIYIQRCCFPIIGTFFNLFFQYFAFFASAVSLGLISRSYSSNCLLFTGI